MDQGNTHKCVSNLENDKKDSSISHVTYALSVGVIPHTARTFNIIPEVASRVKTVKRLLRYLH